MRVRDAGGRFAAAAVLLAVVAALTVVVPVAVPGGLTGMVPGSAAPAAALVDDRACAASLPTTIEEYRQAFAARGIDWAGGDLTGSVVLPDGRILWVFGDTYYAAVAPDGSMIDPWIRNNSAFVQTGRCFDRLGSREHQWIPSPWPGAMLWPQSAIVESGVVRLFLLRVVPTGGEGCFAFDVVGGAVATFGADLRAPVSILPTPATRGNPYGWGVHDHGGFTYLYAHLSPEQTLVARTPEAAPVTDFSQWRFWNGAAWVVDAAAAQPIAQSQLHVATDTAGRHHAYRFTCIEQRLAEYLAGGGPLGPWARDPRHDVDTNLQWHPGADWSYLPTAHPWVPLDDGRMAVAFNLLSFDADDHLADAHLYGARATAVPFPCGPACGHGGRSALVTTPNVRVADTRAGLGIGGRVAAHTPTPLALGTVTEVPAGATAAVVNVTVIGADAPGWLGALRGGANHTGTATVTFGPGEAAGALAVVPLGPEATVTVLSNRSADVTIDVQGWFVARPSSRDGRLVSQAPARILDTRAGGGAPLQPGVPLPVVVSGRGGVPATGAAAVALTVTGIGPSGPGFLQVWPAGEPRPETSNLNLARAGDVRSNLVIVPVGAGGEVLLTSNVAAHATVEVVGWFTDAEAPLSSGGLYVPITPERAIDTRTSTPPAFGPTTRGVRLAGTARVPPGEVGAVFTTLTVTQAGAPSFATASPHGANRPFAATLTLGPGRNTVSVPTLARLGVAGRVDVLSTGGGSLVADVAGYFVAAP